jgi:hypothetical protein
VMSWEPGQGIESHIELAAQVAALVFLVLLWSCGSSLKRRPRDSFWPGG